MAASEYHKGEMDVSEQTSTFHLFLGMAKWGSYFIGILLVFLTAWFCTQLGFFGALVLAGALAVGIGLFLKTKH
jgi:hypothetical protein